MSVLEIDGVPGIKAVVEIGTGDTRVDVGGARFDVSFFDNAAATFSGSEPLWSDITCYAHEVEFTVGREQSTDHFDPGEAQIVLDNSTGWADLNPADMALVGIRAGRQIRVGVDHTTLGRHWKFRGYIDAITPDYDPGLGDIVTIECIDALGEVGRAKLKRLDAPIGADETGGSRIHRILDAAKWPAENRNVVPTSTLMLATDLDGQVLDLMSTIADSEGGAVFGNMEGQIAYRGNEWMMYPPDQLNDGAIGNGGDPFVVVLPGVYTIMSGLLTLTEVVGAAGAYT